LQKTSAVRFIHLSPNTPTLDIYPFNYKNRDTTAYNVEFSPNSDEISTHEDTHHATYDTAKPITIGYGKITEYINVPFGLIQPSIYVSGTVCHAIIQKMVSVIPSRHYTIAIINMLNEISTLLIPDYVKELDLDLVDASKKPLSNSEYCLVRAIHLNPSAPPCEVYLNDQLFDKVAYKTIGKFIEVPSGKTQIRIGQGLCHSEFLLSNQAYSAFFTGCYEPELLLFSHGF